MLGFKKCPKPWEAYVEKEDLSETYKELGIHVKVISSDSKNIYCTSCQGIFVGKGKHYRSYVCNIYHNLNDINVKVIITASSLASTLSYNLVDTTYFINDANSIMVSYSI